MFKPVASFAGFSTNKQEESLSFYRDLLGLQVENSPMGLDISLPSGGRVFIYPKENHQPATFTVLNFVVEDIEAAVTDLKAKGIIFEEYDEEMLKTDEMSIARGKAAGMGPDIAWFKDPAGNFLAVMEE